jgi:dTDP-4-amino-4,6-dideoxygalactose transaminase
MIVTNDPERAEKLRVLRNHGSKPKYHHHVVGGNFRLDAIHAAVISAKLPHLDDWTAGRQRNAHRYDQLFGRARMDIGLPIVVTNRHIFNQYVIRSSARDQLQQFLAEKGVGTEIYYPVPMHLQECFSYLGMSAGAFPESEKAAEQTLALPIFAELTDEQAKYVVDVIADFAGQPAAKSEELIRR